MSEKFVLATHNANKLREMSDILSKLGVLLLLRRGEGPALAGALELDELPTLVHHAVQIHLGPAVLAVLKCPGPTGSGVSGTSPN